MGSCPYGAVSIEYLSSDEPICVPADFSTTNQSTQQAFYFFNLVLINDIEVASNDWVGAFNGDVCVGARQWDTSQCGSGICEVPVLGDDGSDATGGYMNPGEIPSFKIYDASENLYYTAESSENSGWFNGGMPIAEILSANVSIYGCTDLNACNYDETATDDDGSCLYDDCFGDCGGSTEFDICGVCGGLGIKHGKCDCRGRENDCLGVCGGEACPDVCGVCNGPGILDGFCDCDGHVEDCLRVCGGSTFTDDCGECPPKVWRKNQCDCGDNDFDCNRSLR